MDENADRGAAQVRDKPEPAPPKDAKESLYDKLPVTYRQVDLFVKILAAAIVLLLIFGFLSGNR